MGYFVRGQCWQTLDQAKDGYFSTTGPFYVAGSTSYHAWFEKVGAVWQLKRQSISSAGAITNLTTTNATVPAFAACDETQNFSDGMLLGWGVASAMVAVWCIRFLTRALHR